MRLSPRDHDILDALTRRVRAFSIEQLARAGWADRKKPAVFARRRIRELATARYVRPMLVHASRTLALTRPLVTWTAGAPRPDFGPLAWTLQSRWPSEAPEPVEVVLAGRRANDIFGGPSSRPRFTSHHATHDLHVSELYLLFRRTRPGDAAGWLGEDIRPKSGYRLKDPDVLIERGPNDRPLVVEFGGRSYEAAHLRTFHEDCAARGRDYELW